MPIATGPAGAAFAQDATPPAGGISVVPEGVVEKTKMFGYDKDELWNTVIKTYPAVGPFWTYDKAKFLAQPVYSREFPPCGYCE